MTEKKYENRVVKYHNDMNEVAFRKFNVEEFNLFFAMCHKLKEQGTRVLEFSFDEIRDITGYISRDNVRLATDLANTYDKMLSLTFGTKKGLTVERFVLFTSYKVDYENLTLTIKTNEEWQYILNQLQTDFTRFELQEFTQIRSTYSKTMYRLLKQFRQTGYLRLTVDEFRRLLDVPKSYRMTNIEQRVITHLQRELPDYFFDFKIKKIRAKKGNKIEFFDFTFRKEIIFDYTRKNDTEKVSVDENVVEGQVDLSQYFDWTKEE